MRNESNIITDIAALVKAANERKTKQPIGSNQIVFAAYSNASTYDWGGELTAQSQTPSQKGRALLITAKTAIGQNLIADIALRVSKSPTMSPEYTYKKYLTDSATGSGALSYEIQPIPTRVDEQHVKKWVLFMVGDNGQFAYVKIQIIANNNVSFKVEQIL